MTLTFSNSPRWAYCAASTSPHPGALVDQERSEAQLEGECAAWVADCVVRGTAASAAEFEGETAPNGWPVDHAMIRHVQGYVDTVRAHGPVGSETDLQLWGGLVRGRVDQHAGTDIWGNLRVWDFKYGFKIVEPEDNPQLILPAGALYTGQPLITMAIYQPRAHHPAGVYRKWVIGPEELETRLAWLHSAALATRADKPAALPGHHCEHCPRRSPAACHALGRNLGMVYEMLADSRRTGKLTAEELAAELKFMKLAEALVKARKSGTQAEAEARIKNREFIPGWHLQPRNGKRKITAPASVVQRLTGLDPYEAPELKTPAQLEREGASPAAIAMISTTPFAGMELTEFKPADVAKAFKNGK